MLKNFNNKVVVVTGASSGMGRSYAMLLAQHNARLILTDIDEDGLRLTNEVLVKLGYNQAILMTHDVSKSTDWQRVVARCKSEFGLCHMLINNAGIEGAAAPVWVSSMAAVKRTMDVNFYGVVYGTRLFLPLLAATEAAALVNVSSVFGFIGMPNASDYCASKFAVRGYTEALMVELEQVHPHITVHLVHPGGVATEIARSERTSKFKDKFLTTSSDEIVSYILQQILKNNPRIVYGNQSGRAYWGSRLLSLPTLKKMIAKGIKRMMHPDDYRSDHKGFKL